MNHIVFFSGGKSSFSVADWVKEHYPEDNIVLYFTDTLWEDEDLYRFINEGADKLQLPLLTHSLGVNPIQLMYKQLKDLDRDMTEYELELAKNRQLSLFDTKCTIDSYDIGGCSCFLEYD